MEITQMQVYDNPKFFYQCKKHGKQVKYFCLEIQAIDSLLCESCYEERHTQRNVKVLLFELIYNEVQKEISCLNVEELLNRCIEYIGQVKYASQKDNLYLQNEDLIESLMKNLNKSFETLTKLSLMKEKINDKIWSSYFVQAIQNKSAINQAKQCLSEVEQNIEQIKKGYFSYQRGFTVTSAFLLQNNRLLIQESTGNIYIYDSNKLKLLFDPVKEINRKFSKAISAFSISQKKIGVLHENGTLVIYKTTFHNKLTILKRIYLKIVPSSIQISPNFLKMDYKLFKIIINARNFKVLQTTNQYDELFRPNQDQFFENFQFIQSSITRNSNVKSHHQQDQDVFKEKQDFQELQVHTCRKCLTCLSWICKQAYDESHLLKYRNDEKQLIRIFKYGVRF